MADINTAIARFLAAGPVQWYLSELPTAVQERMTSRTVYAVIPTEDGPWKCTLREWTIPARESVGAEASIYVDDVEIIAASYRHRPQYDPDAVPQHDREEVQLQGIAHIGAIIRSLKTALAPKEPKETVNEDALSKMRAKLERERLLREKYC